MEKIEVNTLERDKAVNKAVTEAISAIKLNAANGLKATEFYFPKGIGHSVKSKVTELLRDSKTNFTWCVVKRATNQYTGRIDSFTTDTIGDSKYCKLQIN